jgi:signal transduction histidine kinase
VVLARYAQRFRQAPTIGRIDAPPAVRAVRIGVLLLVVITVPLSTPHFGHPGQGLGIALALTVSAVSWAVWTFAANRPWLWVIAISVMGAAGGVLAGLSSLSSAVSVGLVVSISAGARLSADVSGAIVAETVAAFLIAGIASGATAEAIIGWACGFLGAWAFGLTRRAYLLRALDAEAALEQARRAHKAETQAAALAERARIAREIHDVLAHALAAVSVNLQAAEGLLDAVPEKGPELAKAAECVERAGALTKEGMAEARRAILALREAPMDAPANDAPQAAGAAADVAGTETDRLTPRLRTLVDEHGASGDTTVEFTIAGTPRPLGAERGLTAYRTAQEALTNARKHAPGQPVSLTLTYGPDVMTLEVSNPLPEPGAEGPLARAGTGYGLTGLRERAALAGGTLTAAADDGRWTVLLALPAGAAGQRGRPARESAHDR